MNKKQFKNYRKNGVLFLDRKSVSIEESVKLESGVVIGKNVIIIGKTTVGKDSEIMANTFIENSTIGEKVKVKYSHISDSQVGNSTTVGPYAHIKQNSTVGENCRIGNFVEIKNSSLGKGTKCAHLTYIGDAEIGDSVNLGCGVVFANYDGKKKSKTVVGNGVFIGCNCNLIAPLKIDDGCYIAAGTTVTKNLEKQNFCIGRARQETKEIADCDFLNFLSDSK